ncbi:MAG TPA: hypothetical protein VLI39_15630 [Sedimentisphaerales bacterium]|nr:hypothetical protein [Sedimentisphaerales bacterium]
MRRSRVIVAFLVSMSIAACVRADMSPVGGWNDGPTWPSRDDGHLIAPSVEASVPATALRFDDSGWSAIDLPFGRFGGVVLPAAEPLVVHVLSDDQDSLSLCLYAFLSLGLYRSGHWIKRFSWGAIPHWYHDGGPFQIGHSHAISHDCLGFVSTHGSLLPTGVLPMPMLKHRGQALIAFWRKSQSVPTILASRAPPLRSCRPAPIL